MRYLTRCPFKVDKSSLKSECIRPHTPHPVAFFRKLRNGGHPLMHGAALPIAVFISFRFVEAGAPDPSVLNKRQRCYIMNSGAVVPGVQAAAGKSREFVNDGSVQTIDRCRRGRVSWCGLAVRREDFRAESDSRGTETGDVPDILQER